MQSEFLIFVLQLRRLVERVSERPQPAQPPRLGRASPGEGNSEEGKQQLEPRQGRWHVRGGDCPALYLSFVFEC